MKTTLFDEFLKTNKIHIKELSEPIQKKINVFNEMRDQLDDTIGKDREQLEKRLETLDNEIYENLLEEFEDRLMNNEIIEEEEPKETPKGSEAILEKLFNKGNSKNLTRSYLESLGLQFDHTLLEITIGKYKLLRTSAWSYIFRLEKEPVPKKI